MPTPVESLWQAVSEQKYGEILGIIKANPQLDLVNSVGGPKNRSLLMHLMALPTNKPFELIKSLLTYDKLNLHFQEPTTKQTTLTALISLAQPDLIGVLHKDPRVLFNGVKLSYETACSKLTPAREVYEADKKADPNSPTTQRGKVRVASYEKIIEMLREMTILHAIEKDDPTLFERLELAGANLDDQLSNGVTPVRLLTKNNSRVEAWFFERLNKSMTKQASLSTNTNVFFQMQSIKEQMAKANQEFAKSKIEIYGKGIETQSSLLDRAKTSFSPNGS